MAYVPGRSIEEIQREYGVTDVLKLGSNESATGPSPRAVAAFAGAGDNLRRYPGVEVGDLRAQLGEASGLGAENVVVGNGSADVLGMMARALLAPGDEVIVPLPAFGMYALSAADAGATVVEVPHRDYALDLDGVLAALTPRTRIAYVANPNNPTGAVIAYEVLRAFADRLPASVLLVLDEAYGEFVTDDAVRPGDALVREGRRVLVLRTFSKIHGLAGARVGYGLGPADVIAAVLAQVGPFRSPVAGLLAASAALADVEWVAAARASNAEGRELLTAGMRAHGWRVLQSQANHVLAVDLDAADVISEALARVGVIVRPTSSSFALPRGLRVTVGTVDECRRFLAALDAVLGDGL